MRKHIQHTPLSTGLLAALCALASLCPSGVQASDEPLGFIEVRSQAPLQQLRCANLHHVPWVLPAHARAYNLAHTWKNYWLYQADAFLIDAEVHEFTARARVGLGKGLEIAGELPLRYISGGIMDAMIDRFHRALGINDAGRPRFPRDEFVFSVRNGYGDDGWLAAGDEQAGWNLGNASVALSADLNRMISLGAPLILTAGVKIPISTQNDFFGGQAVDGGFSLATGVDLGTLHGYLSAGAVFYGDEEMIGVPLEQRHLSGLLGMEYKRDGSNHAWTAQVLWENGVALNFHAFSDPTYEVMFGYRCRLSPRTIIEVSVLENLFVFDNGPDFGFHSGITFTR